MNLNISTWPAAARPDWDRRRIHPHDPEPSDATVRFGAIKSPESNEFNPPADSGSRLRQ